MPFPHEFERGAGVSVAIVNAAMAPFGGSRVCIDAYETGIRALTEVQLTVARGVRLEPVRSLAASWANLTRDIGATQLSAARWFLDV